MILFVVLILIVIFYLISVTITNHDYWLKRNVKHVTPVPLFGNHYRNLRGIKNMTEISEEYYWKYPEEKAVGYFRSTTPELIVRDPDIARRILITDFAYFYQRGLGRNTKIEMLMANLFNTDDETWKLLRQKLTPAFTSAKLKSTFPLIVQCIEKLLRVVEQTVINGGNCLSHDLMAGYTMEVIGVCGFGIEMNTINDSSSLYRKFGKIILSQTIKESVLSAVWELFPALGKFLHVYNPKLDEVMIELVQFLRKQRNCKPSNRNDFIDLLLELEKLGVIEGESIKSRNNDGIPKKVWLEMDNKCMAAQLFVFFVAGFETSSTAMTCTLYYLAFDQEMQKKLQKDIDNVLTRFGNKLCYEAVAEMSLLDMAFKESMRMFPPLGVLNRVCAAKYNIPELSISIDPGVKILIPVKAIQNDDRYFDNPKGFRPERFESDDMKTKRAYLPFGDGPRNCIGARLGQMQSLAGLAAVLSKFTVEPAEATPAELEVEGSIDALQVIKGGVPLRLRLRK